MKTKTAVLLVNLGSPDNTSVTAVRRYLAEFLSDRRLIDLPRWLWLPLLHGIILRTRPQKTAEKYRTIWTNEGSPLVVTTKKQCERLTQCFSDKEAAIFYAMRYGNPSIGSVLEKIINAKYQRLLVLPLYPQYSRTTTESIRDKITLELHKHPHTLSVDYITHYYDEPRYIDALANHISDFQARHEKPDKLLFSYHGIPQKYVDKGDIYYQHCLKTTQLLANALGLQENEYLTTFQSRFGRTEWIKPYTDETLKKLPQSGIKTVHILSPAFAADCLETLEELEVENREYFTENGGEIYRYIPALNDEQRHIDVFEFIIRKRLGISASGHT